MPADVRLIASGKGGVGKSTVTVGLASALVKAGCSCLIVDLDFGMRSLDMLLGLESASFTLTDVLSGACTPETGIYLDQRSGIFICPAGIQSDISAHRLDNLPVFVRWLSNRFD